MWQRPVIEAEAQRKGGWDSGHHGQHSFPKCPKPRTLSNKKLSPEAFAERQLQNRDKSMSANVSTILAWSCASLHLFRSSLFAALLKVASRGVAECQSYEMTNLMWAVAELCRRHADMGQEIKPAIRELVLCATPVVLKWHLDTFNLKVLTSALMSLVHFPPMDGLDHKVLISKIVLELAVRDEELASENKVIASAFHAMCKQHPQIYRDVAPWVL